ALELGKPVLQPARARDASFIDQLRALAPDLIVVAAYGQILPGALLEVPRFGCLNVHASLLPKYRGAAPIQWALLDGESETGVTIMKMDAGLDTGAMLSERATPIADADNAATLHDRLATLGADLLISTIPSFVEGKIQPRPQDESRATYARKITKEDGRLDWTQPARVLWNKTRGLTPWPGTFTHAESQLLKVWRASVAADRHGPPGEILCADKSGLIIACGEQALRLEEVQREGGRRLDAPAFLAGHDLPVGSKLG
ncbi:MAG TPA: methionyl-tRNA formyltransferase, partial [Candidatus Cybelea sp.]|nr:methionyl-tRNA formyltransferase [Candidatus Cybelea sp.]